LGVWPGAESVITCFKSTDSVTEENLKSIVTEPVAANGPSANNGITLRNPEIIERARPFLELW
jgi:hypothetical protein